MPRSSVLSAVRFSWLLASVTLACPSFAAGLSAESDLETTAPMTLDRGAVRELQARARALGVTASLGDTTWIGYTPGHFDAAKNWWSIHSGSTAQGYGQPRNGQPGKGMWDWEEPIHGDSLQGWWPIHVRTGFRQSGDHDRDRPFTCIDAGNIVNYVLNASRGDDWQSRGSGTEPGWRTFGVDGVWHVDGGSTVSVPGIPAPTWAPLEGTRSAWMGLRAHGDVTHVDPLTRNAFNEDVYVLPWGQGTPSASLRRFPGYLGRMDQMLYRDIDIAGQTDTSLTISFRYRTNMSTARHTIGIYGWFNHDPLGPTAGAVNPQPNNFISGSDAGVPANGGAPVDSFMVYVGSGVDGDLWLGSDAVEREVHDPKHRWFAEVLHTEWDPASNPANPQPLYYRELLSVAGTVSPTTASFTIPSGLLQRFLEKGPRIRVVFRVKTNMIGDDDRDASVSNGAGAAVVDDVRIRIGSGSEVSLGDFEDPAAIDNHPAMSALAVWKSTGKPPGAYFHREQLDGITYEDVCGLKGEAGRLCNASLGVMTSGNHDRDEEVGTQIEGDAERDGVNGALSPTIQLVDDDANPATPNPIGLYGIGGNGGSGDIQGDFVIRFDHHFSRFGYDASPGGALFLSVTAQSYPVTTTGPTPYKTWSQTRSLPFQFGVWDNDAPICRTLTIDCRQFGLIETSNANGIPDSIRIGVLVNKLDHRFELPVGEPYLDAPFFDNISFGIADEPPGLASSVLSVFTGNWFQDTFPANESPGYPGNASLFDTTAALIKTGNNIGESTPYTVPADSILVSEEFSSGGSRFVRVDMVFRVLPGPGNYEPVGDGVGGMLRRVPSSSATVTLGDGSWWGVMRQNPGDFASPNAASLMQSAAGGWDPNVWISVRCDSAETNLYPRHFFDPSPGPGVGRWQSTIHEADPRFAQLGVVRNRCFYVYPSPIGYPLDIVCNGTVPSYYPPGTVGTTREGTKIIPDGLLTPGAHVEYFFRAQTQETPGAMAAMLPDTNVVVPQGEEYPDEDGHRWQQFSVLPDRWKDPQYLHPVLRQYGPGAACLLVVDWADRLGDERAWVSVADTIGATRAEKYGAHNGWHAHGDQDPNDPAARVAAHGGSPGTTWDLYQVKGGESSVPAGTIGSRLATRDGSPLGQRTARNAPTLEMLNAYYRQMLILTGDLESRFLGPQQYQTDDDVGILTSWLQTGDVATPNRGLWVMGNGFVEALSTYTPGSPQAVFGTDVLHASLSHPNYRELTQNRDEVLDLHVQPEWQGKGAGQMFGVHSPCLISDLDVLAPAGVPPGQVSSRYESPTTGADEIAGIFKPWDPSAPWMSLVEGFSIQDLTGYRNGNTTGRALYFWKVFTNVWAQICNVSGPIAPLDVPHLGGDDLVNFVRLLGNPATDGRARVRFGLTRADRVEARIYDVAGRRVRVLADRNFPAGEHELVWDGLDRAGNRVARGVYFTRFSYRALGFETSRKLTILQ